MIDLKAHDGGFRVAGELTFNTVSGKLPPMAAGKAIEVDLAAVTKADSAGVAWMLGCRRAADANGGTVHFRHIPPRLQDLIRVYGLADLL